MEDNFYLTPEEYMESTGDDCPCKYECMECGCIFYGRWHSNYTLYKVKCPTCQDDTDPLYINILG